MVLADAASAQVRNMDDLLAPFFAACKPEQAFRVGTEAEKIGVHIADGTPVPYAGPQGVEWILHQFADRFGWTRDRETPDGPLLALKRNGASITLEPGAQLELSGAPLHTIHETAAEFDTHIQEVRAICDPLGIAWLGLGFHPFARRAELPWVPKSRYPIMRNYLPTRGSRALDMMQRTCTVQANLDFSSEADAMRKLRVGLALQPITTALFANSPWVEGQRGNHLSERATVWLDMDPDRCGLLPFAWEAGMSFQRYVEWALDVPMFVVKRDGRVIENTRQTFRQFMRDGIGDIRATTADWESHLATLFPEVRLKRIIEVRGADSQSGVLVRALPALWKGLFYDAQALAKAEALVSGWEPGELEAARPAIAQRGLRATLRGRAVGDWADEVVRIARDGLQRIGHRNAAGEDESIHLAPLVALVEKRQTPAEALLQRVSAAALRPSLLEFARA